MVCDRSDPAEPFLKGGIVFGISAALIPAGAIAALAISVNLVADWILNRTTSLKGARGGV